MITTDDTTSQPADHIGRKSTLIHRFRKNLAMVFDENLHTRKWHNIADYLIMAMILISTLEVFLSTFDLDPGVRRVLRYVDVITLVFFTVEVSLRIWAAPELNPRYKGWKGRLRYCTTFHGFIDVLSTFPYYLQWLIPFPLIWIKTLRLSRTLRLFRMSRYMKSWRLLTGAIYEKRRELLISMQVLLMLTLILSLLLFFFEHDAQPDVYDNGFSTVAWSFAQYIGDPGNFGDTPPVTIPGKLVASLVGLLGIAIVAVPAGILGAGFTDAIETENNRAKLARDSEKLRNCFQRVLDRPSRCQVVPPYRTIGYIQTRQDMTQEEILQAVRDTPGFRLVNLGATIPLGQDGGDSIAVEHFCFNRPYGMFIDRNSPVTIVAPSSFIDDCTGFFAYYLAMTGGFNLVSREFGVKVPYRSWYIRKDGVEEPGEAEYFADINRLMSRPGSWSLTSLVASGANEPEYPTALHIGTGNAAGNTSIGDLVCDKAAFRHFYDELSDVMKKNFDIDTDCGEYHSTDNPAVFAWNIAGDNHAGNIVMRLAWSAMLWDSRRIVIARTIAEVINRCLLGLPGNPEVADLKVKKIGY